MFALEPQPEAPTDTAALIDHIRTRYHDRHRADLERLLPLARKVEDVHFGDPDLPDGLAVHLEQMAAEMEDHMTKEEHVLFPMMAMGGHPMIVHPIAMMRAEHEAHGDNAAALAAMTGQFTPPEGACGSWRALYAGLAQFAADLAHHMHLENDILFPRFEAMAADID
jgi:regulator of cell morphogenesis and NO signaling